MSIYPDGIDGYQQIPLIVDGITHVNAYSVNALREAIINIEKELGIRPSGSFNTLSERIDSLDPGNSAVIIDIEARLDALESAVALLEAQPVIPDLAGEQYAVLMEDPAGNLIFQKLYEGMVELDFKISSFSLSGGDLIEVGDTLVNPSFTATYTQTPINVDIVDNQGNPSLDVTATPNAFSYLNSYTKATYGGTVVFSLSGNDLLFSDTDNYTKTWVQKVYWGVGPAGSSSSAFITSLAGSALQTSREATFTVNPGGSEKIYYAYRTGYGDAIFEVNGLIGGFTKVSSSISITNSFGFTENYTLYESDNLGLGTTTVLVS